MSQRASERANVWACGLVFVRAMCASAGLRVALVASPPFLPVASSPFVSPSLAFSPMCSRRLSSPPSPPLSCPASTVLVFLPMPLHFRTCAHARVHTHPPSLTCPATHVSAQHHEAPNAAAHSCTLLHMLSCRGLRVRPRTIAHMHAIHTHKLTQAHPHTHTHATIRSFTRTHRQTDRQTDRQPISR